MATHDQNFLTTKKAFEVLVSMGFDHITLRRVEQWAHIKALPFFKWKGTFYIREDVLRATFDKLQADALNR